MLLGTKSARAEHDRPCRAEAGAVRYLGLAERSEVPSLGDSRPQAAQQALPSASVSCLQSSFSVSPDETRKP